MIDHLGLPASDLARSKAFFVAALAPLRASVLMEGPYGVGIGRDGKPTLWLHQEPGPIMPVHLALAADNREQVRAFHAAALAAGARDNGGPGLRPQYHAHYYGAFVIGPDGHNVEAVCHLPEDPQGG
jgi:catechol 2,3-dioxygenase-like lactoylglutathione lyase family enzyme